MKSLRAWRGRCEGWLRHETSGQATLEFALSFTVITALVFGLFEICMFTYTCSVLNEAAAEGVRYAIMHGTDSTICSGPDAACPNQSPYSSVQAVVKATAAASMHDVSAMTVGVSYANATAAPGNPVTVSIVYTFVPYVNFSWIKRSVTFTSAGQVIY
jgi:Flp pilus assembly protein TadG